MSQRKKQELFGQIDFLPGHKQRLTDLFRRVDNVSQRYQIIRSFLTSHVCSVVVSSGERDSNIGKCHESEFSPVAVPTFRIDHGSARVHHEYVGEQAARSGRVQRERCNGAVYRGRGWQRAWLSCANISTLNLACKRPTGSVGYPTANAVSKAGPKRKKSLKRQAFQSA